MMDWLTNDPTAARRLRAADRRHDAARKAAAHLPLADKVAAYRVAKLARRAEQERLLLGRD